MMRDDRFGCSSQLKHKKVLEPKFKKKPKYTNIKNRKCISISSVEVYHLLTLSLKDFTQIIF